MSSRTRSDGMIPIVGTYEHHQLNLATNVDTITGTHVGPVSISLKNMTDVVTPSFRKKRGSGSIINNPCQYVVRQYQAGAGSYLAVPPSSSSGYKYYSGGNGSLTNWGLSFGALNKARFVGSSDLTSLIDRAKAKAIADINSAPNDMLEDLLEIRETVDFLHSGLSSLVQYSKLMSTAYRRALQKERRNLQKRLRKKDLASRPGGKRAPKDSLARRYADRTNSAANVYAQYQWALMPLVRSIVSVKDLYNKRNNLPKISIRRNARGFEARPGYDKRQNLSNSVFSFSETFREDVKVHAHILYEYAGLIDQSMRARLGLTTRNLPAGLWAVFSRSFMIDRVTDIQSFVRGIININDPDVKVLCASVTVRHSTTSEIKLENQNNPGTWTVTINGDTVKDKNFSYIREPFNPSVADVVPGFDLSGLVSTATRCADLSAIVIQTLHQLKKG